MPLTLIRLPMLAILCIFTAEMATAQSLKTSPIRPGDEIWLVNSRSVVTPNSPLSSLQVSRAAEDGQWLTASIDELLSSSQPILIYVHGNRVDLPNAIQRGSRTYEEMFDNSCSNPQPPVRFIIWSWPADKIPGPIRDFRDKAEIADCHAVHLARFITALPQETFVNVIGFSYGGRLAIGASHLYAGGRLDGRSITTTGARRHNISLTLFAPAIRNDCFSCGYDRALSNVNQVFLLYNSRDPVLKFFRLARFDFRKDALGFTGVKKRINSSVVFRQHDAQEFVGAEHDYLEYIRDPQIERRVHQNLIFPTAQP